MGRISGVMAVKMPNDSDIDNHGSHVGLCYASHRILPYHSFVQVSNMAFVRRR